MKKIILSISAIVGALSLNAQIAMMIEGTTTDISGQTHTIVTTDDAEHIIDILIQNQSSNAQDWVITRKRINVTTPQWTDYLCWGAEGDPFGGTCYGASQMATNPWTTPQVLTVAPNMKGLLAIHIDPDLAANQYANYRYYVGRTADTPDDSVDIVFNPSASVKKKEVLSVLSVYPNPSNESFQIESPISGDLAVKITDVLGNVVFDEKISQGKKVSTNDLKNGVYMVTVVASNGTKYTKRLIVKH